MQNHDWSDVELFPSKWDPAEYALLDFGAGRKLERFGGVLLDRPSPAANSLRCQKPHLWADAVVRLDDHGKPTHSGIQLPDSWTVRFGAIACTLTLTPFGHVGLFPEQFANWYWLSEVIRRSNSPSESPVRVLNLFAYTGGTTLAAAASGAQVAHVDASAPAVRWARKNAEASGLHQCPIRWIVEDVRKFVTREIKRGNCYDIIVLDPPSYGHGPSGKSWRMQSDLEPLLSNCIQLLGDSPDPKLLLTAHSVSPNETQMVQLLQQLGFQGEIGASRLAIQAETGAKLDAGFCVRGAASL